MYKKEVINLLYNIGPKCTVHHDRDINASINIRREGLRILRENNSTIIFNKDSTVGTTFNTFGEDVRLMLDQRSLMNYESIAL